MFNKFKRCLYWLLPVLIITACKDSTNKKGEALISQLNLKSGNIISCGPPGKEFGIVNFEITGDKTVQTDFNMAVELLHSFEYDEAEKAFAKIIEISPRCAMAFWGVAMCNFHPLWEPPTEYNLIKGEKAIAIARSISEISQREKDYINAVAVYYNDWKNSNPRQRADNFERAMEQLHTNYPGDDEAAIFYALSLDAAADPSDKTYKNQLKAGDILNTLYKKEPNHPGIIHYIIHNYDYPGIATMGLAAARRYADVAPSSAHAVHMPSHIFTRLGLWDDCIKSNIRSVASAKCYAESAGINGHWDEELHGLDYLIYAYLQKGDNKSASEQLSYVRTIKDVYPANFKCAYTFAAAPARMALENKNWKEATAIQLTPVDFPWKKFPWQEAIVHFARLLGYAHEGNTATAEKELEMLHQLNDTLQSRKELYQSKQVLIQITAGEAWIAYAKGNKAEALNLMKTAAGMEDSTSKHPVTPGEVLPAKELYADMLVSLGQFENALAAYEQVLERSPNRFNSLYGAGSAAERSGRNEKALYYYKQLAAITDTNSARPELNVAKAFLQKHNS